MTSKTFTMFDHFYSLQFFQYNRNRQKNFTIVKKCRDGRKNDAIDINLARQT